MGKRFSKPSGSSTSVSWSTSTSTSSGQSEGFGSGETFVERYDPMASRGARALLLWNLGDLRNNLHRAGDLTPSDCEWYLAQARALFDNALQKKDTAAKEDRNDAE